MQDSCYFTTDFNSIVCLWCH